MKLNESSKSNFKLAQCNHHWHKKIKLLLGDVKFVETSQQLPIQSLRNLIFLTRDDRPLQKGKREKERRKKLKVLSFSSSSSRVNQFEKLEAFSKDFSGRNQIE